VAANGLGLPVRLHLTAGQVADVTQAGALLAGAAADVVIGDQGYDSNAVVAAIRARGADAVIPPKRNRREPRPYDTDRYKARNLVERFWGRAKPYRRVATRYEKTARNFLGFVHLASIMILVR